MKITLVIICILVALLIAVYALYGGFKDVNPKIENQGGEIIIYENVRGDYKQTPEVTDKIYYSLLNDEKIETTKGIGIFYDNPQNVNKDDLRSEVGCIVENVDSTTIEKLSEKYHVKKLPKNNYIVTEFPYKGGISIMIGIMKVYPALDKYCKKHGFQDAPITEIYDAPNKKIIYRKEILK